MNDLPSSTDYLIAIGNTILELEILYDHFMAQGRVDAALGILQAKHELTVQLSRVGIRV
jgi:hypothetical protein